MKRILQFLLLTSVFFMACKEAPVEKDADGKSYFGEKIENIDPISYGTLLEEMEKQDTVYAQVEATVESVCQTKGCWMNLVDGNSANDNAIFVKFKDYGFFVPKDIAGRKVIVKGKAYKEITPVDELRHYAEDEGKSREEIEAITEPEEELKFMADGVVLL